MESNTDYEFSTYTLTINSRKFQRFYPYDVTEEIANLNAEEIKTLGEYFCDMSTRRLTKSSIVAQQYKQLRIKTNHKTQEPEIKPKEETTMATTPEKAPEQNMITGIVTALKGAALEGAKAGAASKAIDLALLYIESRWAGYPAVLKNGFGKDAARILLPILIYVAVVLFESKIARAELAKKGALYALQGAITLHSAAIVGEVAHMANMFCSLAGDEEK